MKNLNTILLSLLITCCISPVVAMRRCQQLLVMRHGITLPKRCISTAPRIPHPNWLFNECYKALKNDPKNIQNIEQVAEQDDYTKQTLLRAATADHHSSPLVFSALLEAGAKINEPDIEGQTPLHLLAQNSTDHYDETKLMEIFMLIAQYKPNFEVVDTYGMKPRDYAPERFRSLFVAQEAIKHPTVRYMFPGN